MYTSVLCVLCILVTLHNLCCIKFGPSWKKYCLNHYSLTHLKVELGCLNSADIGANIHTAMTLADMSKIIINPLITILFMVETGAMAPICVRMLGCTPMQT
jgi:hypothetical protein